MNLKEGMIRHRLKVIEGRISALTTMIDVGDADQPVTAKRRDERKALRWAIRVIEANIDSARALISKSEAD